MVGRLTLHTRATALALVVVLATALVGTSTVPARTAAAAPMQAGTTTYLSDLTPLSALNGAGPYRRDRNNHGDPIKLDGKTYAKGLGVYPRSDITYSLNRNYATFLADVGIDDICAGSGSVQFEVYLDGTKAFSSGVVRGTTLARRVSLGTSNTTKLRLVLTDGGDGISCEYADWADAQVLPLGPAPTSTTLAPTTTTTAPPTVDPVLVGAGDIASCTSTGDEATANLLDGIPGTVFTAGDNAYPKGSASDFTNCYGPSWGRHKSRTRPAAGNHDYDTLGPAGYHNYFGAAAGDPTKGYYSYDLGSWHVVVVNSICSQVGGCDAGSPQEQWVRQDLAASSLPCTVAYWHHPLFTSGFGHTNATEMRPIFQALYDSNAEVVLSGHNHNYERFAQQDPNGNLDITRGIREFVVGTGGVNHTGFSTTQPNSQVRNADTFGVLKLTLRANGYDWVFAPEAGKTFTDSGSGTCH